MKTRSIVAVVSMLSILPLFLLSAFAATVTDQHTLSVSAVVEAPPPPEEPKTIVQFQGLAYPSASIQILKNGSTWLSTTATSTAAFATQSEILAGTYTFTIQGTDIDGVLGPSLSLSVTIAEGTTVSASGIFLGPTIQGSASSIRLDEGVQIQGYTAPNSQLTLYLSGPDGDQSFSATAHTDGRWSYTLQGGQELSSIGTYSIRARAVATDSSISEYSSTLTFVVSEATEPDPCSYANIADLNCDGSVDLVDFSILLYYWLDTHPANTRADIDKSGLVDVVDFSIMMFHWTG
ncbi:MAG: hypothetical protein H6760_04315 [Candidatus Nomurabacteria bacterium]|nr:MAG: hypothetical protein H6760_04315 [Candidatus Nomurabacteria bacterium]